MWVAFLLFGMLKNHNNIEESSGRQNLLDIYYCEVKQMQTTNMKFCLDDPMYTISDIQRIFDLSPSCAYRLMHSRGFPSFTLNRRIYVHPERLNEWILRQTGKRHKY